VLDHLRCRRGVQGPRRFRVALQGGLSSPSLSPPRSSINLYSGGRTPPLVSCPGPFIPRRRVLDSTHRPRPPFPASRYRWGSYARIRGIGGGHTSYTQRKRQSVSISRYGLHRRSIEETGTASWSGDPPGPLEQRTETVCDFGRPPFVRWFVERRTSLLQHRRPAPRRAAGPERHLHLHETGAERATPTGTLYARVNAFADVARGR